MDNINKHIIDAMIQGGVSPRAIRKYKQELSAYTDNLETIGCYWSMKVAQLNVNIRTHADVCMLIRDTTSEVLWLNTFRQRLIPIMLEYKMLNEDCTYA